MLKDWADPTTSKAHLFLALRRSPSPLVPTGAYPRLILIDRNLKVINANIFPQNDETIREKILEAL